MEKLKQLQEEIELKFKDMKCLVNKENLKCFTEKNNLTLPNTAYPESIQEVATENMVKCYFCNSEHLISNIKEFSPIGQEINEFIQFYPKIIESINILIEEYDNIDKQVEIEAARLKQEIKEKLSDHKEKIELVHLKMIEKLELIQENLIIQLNNLIKKIDKKNSEYETLSEKIADSIDDIDESQLIKEVYKFQDLIDQMKNLEETFQNIFKKLSFEPSLWRPTEDFIHPSLNKFK